MKKLIIVILLLLGFIVYGKKSDPGKGKYLKRNKIVRSEILKVLNKFQEGYTKRDLSNVKKWTQEIMTDDIYFIGTNGVYHHTGEWQVGIDKAEKMFGSDWERWGVFKADIKNSDIRVLSDNIGMVAFTAVVTKSPENGFGRTNEENMKRSLKRLSSLDKNTAKLTKLKLYTAIWDIGTVLKHTELGETFNWPVRITMTIVKKKGNWKINHAHFSYPSSGYPSIRIVDGKVVSY